MELLDFSLYRGRNIHSHRPVVKMTIDIGDYWDTPTKDIPKFHEKLLASFPGLKTNTCSLGYEGGFMKRLHEGTYLGHVLEHAILDLQNTLGFDVKYGKTRLCEEPSIYHIIYQFENEICALECGKVAVFVFNCFLNGEAIIIDEFIEYLEKIKLDTELGPSTAAIVSEAKKRGIPVSRIGYESLVRLGYGKHSKMIQSTLSDATSCIAADISSNKQLTKIMLDDHKVPVPYGKVVYTEISAVMAAKQIGMPVVVKPFDSNQGKGVSINLMSEDEIKNAFQDASKYSSGIIVEKYTEGNDYRILVVGGKIKAVSHRLPAMVIGDGIHTIKELVKISNLDPRRGESHEKPLTKIKLDAVSLAFLQKTGRDAEYLPPKGEHVPLRSNGNISTGGTAVDCTDIIHPDNAEIAINAATAIGIDIAGIDMVAEDISKSIRTSSGAVIEVNAAPGIRMHLYPSEGKPRNVAKDILDMLFPDDSAANFPIVSVTGTNGKTTTVRLISHVLSLAGKTVGMTSTSGTYINGKCICAGDNSGPRSAKALLANKAIDAAVLETARGGIMREGLGYDLADVGIVTNISDDHLGLDGIDTLEDLAFVKALVAEAIKPDGYSVLNAEDTMTNMILNRIKTKAILFYKNRGSVIVEDIDQYKQVFVEDSIIYIKENNAKTDIINVHHIPISMNGLSECNIDNCLAAVSALFALNISTEVIAQGLKSFEHNPGRFQLFQKDGYEVMLDYAHNPAGYGGVLKLCERYPHKRLVGIIGMPGDRPDSAIKKVGQLAAKTFDKIYIREDTDLRGRDVGEVADILFQSIREQSFEMNQVKIIHSEVAALKDAINFYKAGDLILALYEHLDPLVRLLNQENCD